MQLATFLSSPSPPGAGAGAAAAGSFSNPLDLSISHAVPTNWCWAAVTSAITAFYATYQQIGQALSPCQVATNCMGRECCPPPQDPSDPRNTPFGLEGALNTAVHGVQYLDGNPSDGPLDFPSIVTEIDNGRPVCVLISWKNDPGNVGHYIIVVGYVAATQEVDVRDNKNGDGRWLYSTVCDSYHTTGSWQATYKTLAVQQ